MSPRLQWARLRWAAGTILLGLSASAALADTAAKLEKLDITTLPADERAAGHDALGRSLQQALRAAGEAQNVEWRKLKSADDWKTFQLPRIAKLRASMNWPVKADPPAVQMAEAITGDGWVCVPLIYESRPGVWVTADLYRPAKPTDSMPCLILSHSHHNPKTETELRDMGCGWAKAGCMVLVPDHLGHGQRRAHSFNTAADWPKQYRVGRQDYYFRYMSSLQLYAAGESLMGWLAWDLSRGVDVLLAQPGADRSRIALLGAVAGGGDPAAVAAALDSRITAVAPFNFGGPQPETKYPLPDDAEERFNYTGGGSWESTRNLHRSAADGFLPWVIVGSVSPRVLVYGHEFSWDRPRDPVWKRLETIWAWNGSPDKLGFATGRGTLSGKAPEATHCNNIGPVHRAGVADWLNKTLKIPPPMEVKDLPSGDAVKVPAALAAKVRPLHEVLADQVKKQGAAPRAPRERWAAVLGDRPGVAGEARVTMPKPVAGGVKLSQTILTCDGLPIPLTYLYPPGVDLTRRPAVLMFAQQGKQKLLEARRKEVAELLDAGMFVVMADLRGLGETSPGNGRERGSEATSLSATALMLGDPLMAGRLRDLRLVLTTLKNHPLIDASRIALWGDSLSAANDRATLRVAPLDADQPKLAEPNAAILAWLAADGAAAVYTNGGLSAYRDLYSLPAVYLPHDAIVPGVIGTGDLPALRKAIAVPTRNDGLVDGGNRLVDEAKPAEPAVAWIVRSLR